MTVLLKLPLRLALLSMVLFTSFAHAQWTLDGSKSRLSFVTTKAVNVGEVHQFDRVSGSVDEAGQAELRIDLASVNTAIPIRDERIRKLLFETNRFPDAVLSTRVPMDELAKLKAGEMKPLTLEGDLGIRGISAPVSSSVDVIKLADGSLQVVSRAPVLVNAADLKLLEGVEKLREIAGLPSIGQNVAVSFQLNFRPGSR
ncbi:YceI family protein [Proteobacteria bacterium 005FR1]|nr:YceI family protein [Proteobacteria bacterium 005FR1]